MDITYEKKLRNVYGITYDFLKEHPEFDGRPHSRFPGFTRKGVDPSTIPPWPGVADVRRMDRETWIEARIDGVRRGEEEPALRPPQQPPA